MPTWATILCGLIFPGQKKDIAPPPPTPHLLWRLRWPGYGLSGPWFAFYVGDVYWFVHCHEKRRKGELNLKKKKGRWRNMKMKKYGKSCMYDSMIYTHYFIYSDLLILVPLGLASGDVMWQRCWASSYGTRVAPAVCGRKRETHRAEKVKSGYYRTTRVLPYLPTLGPCNWGGTYL